MPSARRRRSIPKGTGTWVAPGQNFRFQMHYTPYGKATVEKTRVGLYFYPKDAPPEILRRSAVVANAGIEIPPNDGAPRGDRLHHLPGEGDAVHRVPARALSRREHGCLAA